MIRKVILRRFKRFTEETFEFPGNIVLAGPNNTGKTTVLQAIAAWDLALKRWRELNRFRKHKGVSFTRAPIARQAFAAVPLRTFDLLWSERAYQRKEPIEIEIHSADGWQLAMELTADSTEQIYVRPRGDVDPTVARDAHLQTVYVPPMTGLSTEEPVYQPPKQRQLLGQGKPGDIIRNLLVQAHQTDVWNKLQQTIQDLFECQLLPPDSSGPNIVAEYVTTASGSPRFDVASAGSGFQQVLMLLTFLYTNSASVLLLDEPDAHLHVLLQDTIYGTLRSVAAGRGSQLIIATHSEVIINAVEPRELCMLLDHPRLLAKEADPEKSQERLNDALRYLTNMDIMLAKHAPGIIYVEGRTDIDILREWARILDHPIHAILNQRCFWKPKVIEVKPGAPGCNANEHFEILKLVKSDIKGIELVDGDDNRGKQSTPFQAGKLQRLRWQRYEIESYLIHPAAIERYIEHKVGPGEASELNRRDARIYLEEQLPGSVKNPLGEILMLEGIKASERIIPAILSATGIHGVIKRDFYEIAAIMQPEEIHPEVIEKLNAIQQAFGI